jgi:hypothetical protein
MGAMCRRWHEACLLRQNKRRGRGAGRDPMREPMCVLEEPAPSVAG